jgi:hypothetical protein
MPSIKKKLIVSAFAFVIASCGVVRHEADLSSGGDGQASKTAIGFTKVVGYLALDHGEQLFVAVDVDASAVVVRLPLNTFFAKKDIAQMVDCMDLRKTHAITLELHKSVPQRMSNGIRGAGLFGDFPSYRNIRCERMPGFLQEWRSVMYGKNSSGEMR